MSFSPETRELSQDRSFGLHISGGVKQVLARAGLAFAFALVPTVAEVNASLEAAALTTFVNDYPDMDAVPCGNGDWCKNGSVMSPRGYYYRNCTDGASYWANKYTGYNPQGWGDAIKWDDNAQGKTGVTVKSGISNDVEPGDIAQSNDANYGHVGFVTDVTKDSAGRVISLKIAELNNAVDGKFTHITYSTRNGAGKFPISSGMDWDNFIDVNGPNRGLNNEDLTAPVPASDIRVPVAADFTGDGHSDLLASTKRSDAAPNLQVFPSTGAWLGGAALWSAPPGVRWADAKITTGDLDGDGKDDVLAIQRRNDGHPEIFWMKSQGGSFAGPQLVGVPNLWFDEVKTWEMADFTGDGHDDLLAVAKRWDSAPNFVVFPSTGAWLGGEVLWGAPGEIKWGEAVVVPADLDGDGKKDLLSMQKRSTGEPEIFWSRSMGSSFASPQLVGVPGLTFNNINAWQSGDFNGDGHDDLLASSKRSDTAPNLLVFPSTGAWLGGNSLWSAPGEISWANANIVPADVDGDGKTDLLAIQQGGGNDVPFIYWIRSQGSSFAGPQLVGVPNWPNSSNTIHWQQ